MSSNTSIPSGKRTLFLIGPGFIGGTILSQLLASRPSDFHIKVLTRRQEQADQLKAQGIHETILGSLDDTDLIASHAKTADVVIHAATADHAPSALAVADGLKQRDTSRGRAIFIHTSGNDELVGAGKPGMSKEDRKVSDAWQDEEIEKRMRKDAYHRQVDGPLREAIMNDEAEQKYNIRTVILMPPLIYGISPSAFGSRLSIQTPMLARSMLARGPFVLSEGYRGGWNAVSVDDVASTYLVTLKELEKEAATTGKGRHYVFPSEPEPFSWKEHIDAVSSRVLAHTGASPSSVRTISTPDDFEAAVGGKEENPYAPCLTSVVFDEEHNGYTRPERLTKEWGFKHQSTGVIKSILEGGELEGLLKEEAKKA